MYHIGFVGKLYGGGDRDCALFGESFFQTIHVGNLSDQVGFSVSGTVIYRPGGYFDIKDINISTFDLYYNDSYQIVSKSDTYFTLSVQGGDWPAGQEDSHPNAINMSRENL